MFDNLAEKQDFTVLQYIELIKGREMRKSRVARGTHALMAFVSIAAVSIASAPSEKEPVDYVNSDIGSIGILIATTRSVVQLPHDYPLITPMLNPGITDSYLATKIYGFPVCGGDFRHFPGAVSLMPATGSIKTDPNDIASSFDRDFETRTPYYYEGLLEDYNIEASYTVGHFAVFYRFRFPSAGNRHINIMMGNQGWMQTVSPAIVEGSTSIAGALYYFYLEFSKPYEGGASWQYDGKPEELRRIEGEKIGLTLNFAGAGSEWVQVKVGLSFISLDQAEKNLNEAVQGWNFELREQQTKAAWNKLLGKIDVEGGTEKQKRIFYSSLYRAQQRMVNITEDGRYYSGFDHKVHNSNGRDFYTEDALWDSFRCQHPLQLLLDAKQQEDMIQSLVRMYEQWGWLPSSPRVGGEIASMIGNHADAVIADTYFKGYRDFDVEKAYEAMKKQALQATMLSHRRGPMTELDKIYLQKGFFPALKEGEEETHPEVHPSEKRQAVSVTLEAAYDDWCIARMAKVLGHAADYDYFTKVAYNYRNVFDKSIGFMAPKSADGEWVKGFNPILPSGPGGRDYFAECNAWVWTFNVEHDVAGLIQLFGGREAFLHKLDSLFEVQYGGLSKHAFLAKFDDMTGLIGDYAQGDEPSFHIAYMYDFAGEPWRTQKIIREIMDVWYDDTLLGLPGDDDWGVMGAWYVLSAMGFYSFCPGEPYYVIGSPLFRETTIHLSSGRTFTIKADDVSTRNKYIQSATLNGKPLTKPWFTQQDIGEGGTLELRMGPRPNKDWGSAPDDAPPSLSSAQASPAPGGNGTEE